MARRKSHHHHSGHHRRRRRHHAHSSAMVVHRASAPAVRSSRKKYAEENPMGGFGEVALGTAFGALLGFGVYEINNSAATNGSQYAVTGGSMGEFALVGAIAGLLVAGAVVLAQKV